MKGIAVISAAAPVLATFAMLAGCEEETIGGPCRYTDYPGTATIRSVITDISPDRNCENAVIITFDFAPDDPSAPDRYRFPAWADTGRTLDLFVRGSVPAGWADKEGFTSGSEHPCRRQEIRTGPCSPLCFDFPDVDYSDLRDYCD